MYFLSFYMYIYIYVYTYISRTRGCQTGGYLGLELRHQQFWRVEHREAEVACSRVCKSSLKQMQRSTSPARVQPPCSFSNLSFSQIQTCSPSLSTILSLSLSLSRCLSLARYLSTSLPLVCLSVSEAEARARMMAGERMG